MMTLQERIAKIDQKRAERENAPVVLLKPSTEAYAQNEARRASSVAAPAAEQPDDRVGALPVGLRMLKNRRLNALQNVALKRSKGETGTRPRPAIHV